VRPDRLPAFRFENVEAGESGLHVRWVRIGGTYVHELAEGNIDGDARLDVLRYAEQLTWIVPFSAIFQARVG
jgi:hypothetical protein